MDEDLPNFFEALKLYHADQIVCEYHNMKDRYGIEIEDARVIKRLEQIQLPEKTFQGTPWYNILSNYDYVDKFNYLNAMIKDRAAYVKDINKDKNVQSEVCVLLLNLATIPDEIVHNFNTGLNSENF